MPDAFACRLSKSYYLFHEVKCDLGNINLKAMLVSSFPNNVGAGLMPLGGAPHNLYMQLLACSSSQSVFAIALLRACHFLCCVFFPTLLPSVQGQVCIG